MDSIVDRSRRTLSWIALLICALVSAQAVDVPSVPAAGGLDSLEAARVLVAEGKWDVAIQELTRLDRRGSADWNHLMGYSLLQASLTEFATAGGIVAGPYLETALRLDPKHRGALEAAGLLALEHGDLRQAEARWAVLDKTCFLPCAPARNLRVAIDAYLGHPQANYMAMPY